MSQQIKGKFETVQSLQDLQNARVSSELIFNCCASLEISIFHWIHQLLPFAIEFSINMRCYFCLFLFHGEYFVGEAILNTKASLQMSRVSLLLNIHTLPARIIAVSTWLIAIYVWNWATDPMKYLWFIVEFILFCINCHIRMMEVMSGWSEPIPKEFTSFFFVDNQASSWSTTIDNPSKFPLRPWPEPNWKLLEKVFSKNNFPLENHARNPQESFQRFRETCDERQHVIPRWKDDVSSRETSQSKRHPNQIQFLKPDPIHDKFALNICEFRSLGLEMQCATCVCVCVYCIVRP